MSRYLRPRIPGASIFFTVVLADRESDLLLREIVRLREAAGRILAKRPVDIGAWVVLPDHLHAVWTLPLGDCDYSGRWAAIKAGFSHGLPSAPLRRSQVNRREKGIWQRRFWKHHLRGESEYAAAIRYCWTNPVRHGLAGDPADWPDSSWHRDAARGLTSGFDHRRGLP
ncbi:transposase [Paracoccus sp. SSK6]|uniref:REP-associated tyrosine transposase n=1 Tax=Paracoccus sp. SSK6 TaxID=3143131 RepID=UPI00321A1C73